MSVTEAGSGSCFATMQSHRCFHVWQYTAPAVVDTSYDQCHIQCITVPGIHIPLGVSSIYMSVLQTVIVEYIHFNHGSSWHDLPYPPDAHGVHLHEDQYWMVV